MIDISVEFASYRIGREDGTELPAGYLVMGRYGTLWYWGCVDGVEYLGVSLAGNGVGSKLCGRLVEAGVEVIGWGDGGEFNGRFAYSGRRGGKVVFRRVVRLIGARRRRTMSPETREKLVERMAKAREARRGKK